MIKLIVFGPTGKSGIAITRTALQSNCLEVSVFVRSPHKLPSDVKPKVNVIVGDVLDQNAVNSALQGQQIVVSALGKGMNLAPTTLISEGTANVIKGMQVNEVKKLLVVSVSTELSPDERAPFFLKAVIDDHTRMISMLKKSENIDWCGVMVPEIFQLPYTGKYEVEIGKRPGPHTVVALDMAHFIISCATNDEKWLKYKNNLVGVTTKIPLSTLAGTNQGKFFIALATGLVALISFGIAKIFR